MLYYLAWDIPPHGILCRFESYIKNITNSNDKFKELPIFISKQKRIPQIYVFLGLQKTPSLLGIWPTTFHHTYRM